MNVFKRFSDIVSSNINSALDKMEDPKKMINLMIGQMEDTAIEIRASIAEKTASLTTIERQAREAGEAVARWTERARLAVEKGNDTLAREAICEKQSLEARIKALDGNITTLKSIITSLQEQLAQVEGKLADMKAKRADLIHRAEAAKEQKKNNETIKMADSSDFARRFEELQARIERWEAEAKIMGSTTSAKSTAETFREMEENKAVEDELEALKKSLKEEKE